MFNKKISLLSSGITSTNKTEHVIGDIKSL